MRSTPIEACEIYANIEPLMKEKIGSKGVERYRTFQESHPNRTLVDSWVPNRRLKQGSPLDTVAQLSLRIFTIFQPTDFQRRKFQKQGNIDVTQDVTAFRTYSVNIYIVKIESYSFFILKRIWKVR